MQYTTLLLAALASLAAAQNPFTMTSLSTITAGTPYNITWAPSTGTTDTVTLVLRQGNSKDLTTIQTIASSIPNSGSYLWTPSPTLVAGTGYAFEIVDDGNTDITNYSGQFTIDSTNTVSSAVPSSTSSSPSSSASSAVTTSSGTTSGTSASSTGSVSSGSSASTTRSSSASGKQTSSGTSQASSVATKSSGTSTGTSSSSTSTATGNAATVVKVGGALLGVVGAVMAAL